MPELADLTQSESVQNFLKAVYALQPETEDWVSTNALADALRISAPSVTDMAQRLAAAGLLQYKRYGGVRLSDDGEALALKIVRRHRLIELYLVEELGYALRDVHAEAENLEHAVSDHFIEAVARKLGNPVFDPHGDPIPSREGVMAMPATQALAGVPEGGRARVARISDDSNSELLRYLAGIGLVPGAEVRVVALAPFMGPLTIEVGDQVQVIGRNLADLVLVQRIPEDIKISS